MGCIFSASRDTKKKDEMMQKRYKPSRDEAARASYKNKQLQPRSQRWQPARQAPKIRGGRARGAGGGGARDGDLRLMMGASVASAQADSGVGHGHGGGSCGGGGDGAGCGGGGGGGF